MKKKYILYDINSQEYFTCISSRKEEEWNKDKIAWDFESIEEAEKSLELKYEYDPFGMSKRKVIIIPIYKFQNPN